MRLLTRVLEKINEYNYRQRRKKEWRQLNSHNETTVINDFNFDLVKIGRYTYGDLIVEADRNESKLTIGDFCSIAYGTVFILCRDHEIHHFSTYPFKVMCLKKEKYEATSKGNINIGDDVWIAHNCTIMSGVNIGQGAVIAAGAVVTKDIPPYAIAGGVPAKVIKYRFDEETISKLLEVDFSKIDKKFVEEHINELYMELDKDKIEWLPKKQVK